MNWRRLQRGGIVGAAALWAGLLIFLAGDGGAVAAPSAAGGQRATAPADTLLATLRLPEGEAPVAAMVVSPDTVAFGGLAYAQLEWGPAAEACDLGQVAFAVDWLSVAGDRLDQPLPEGIEQLPAENRLVIPFRVYQLNPFRLKAGTSVSQVIQVRGMTAGTSSTAPIRQPRPWGRGALFLVVAALALAAALVAALWWVWRRRGRREDPWVDWEVAWPAWLDAAVGLRQLVAGDALARGDGRGFLDALAALTRRFVGTHYGIPAQEMTGPEIVAACVALGFPADQPRRFAQLIDLADRRRYAPEQPDTAFCLAQAGQLCQQMQAAWIIPRQTVIPPSRLLQAQQAWAAVAAELGLAGTGGEAPGAAGGG